MQGEQIATDFLVNKGYRILKRNYRHSCGEIDIIAFKQGIMVFVEVKTRTSLRYGTPEEAINKSKIHHIKSTAMGFLSEFNISFKEIRFDVIAIYRQGDNFEINHIEAAF